MTANKTHFKVIDHIESRPESIMVLIGTAFDGPSNVPFTINSNLNPYTVLGSSPLAKAFVQAYNAGANNIILYRINGSHSTATLSFRNQDNSLTNIFKFQSVSANDLYNSIADDGTVNNIRVEIDGTSLIVTNSDGSTRTYLLRRYPSASSLADALNIDSEYGLIEFETFALVPDFKMSSFTEDTAFTASFTGANTEETLIIDRANDSNISTKVTQLMSKLKIALFGENVDDQVAGEPNSMLGMMDFGGIAVADLYYEDDPKLAHMFGMFCQNKSSYSGHGCVAVIGTTPLYNPTADSIDAKGAKLLQSAPIILFKDPGGLSHGTETEMISNTILPISYVQIVIGDTITDSVQGEFPQPFSIAFAYLGMQVSTAFYSNVTNKSLEGISDLGYQFSKEVLDNLAANGYISIVRSIRKGYVPYHAITCVGRSSSSSFRKPHYIRISQHIGRMLNDNLDYLVGSVKQRTTTSDVQKRIEDLMQNLVDSGAVRGYSVVCEFSNYNTNLRVSVSFTPYSDVESVTTITTLPLGQGVIR